MLLNYDFNIKDGVFKYDCITCSSFIKIRAKDIKKLYYTLNKLDFLEKQAVKDGTRKLVYNGFEIIFDFRGYVSINNASNWLDIEKEVPIIKRELSKYIKKYDKENIKDIIVKIKSLKRGSSNRIKED